MNIQQTRIFIFQGFFPILGFFTVHRCYSLWYIGARQLKASGIRGPNWTIARTIPLHTPWKNSPKRTFHPCLHFSGNLCRDNQGKHVQSCACNLPTMLNTLPKANNNVQFSLCRCLCKMRWCMNVEYVWLIRSLPLKEACVVPACRSNSLHVEITWQKNSMGRIYGYEGYARHTQRTIRSESDMCMYVCKYM